MADAVWYFAIGDEERGPVTEHQIRALIGTGNLKPDDLVWKEGLDDWVPAGEVPGLFDKEDSPKSGNATPAPPGEGPVKPPSTPPGKTPPEAAPVSPPILASHHEPLTALHLTQPVNLLHYVAFFGQPLLLVGFLLVLLSRGCDVIGERYAERVKAKWQITEGRFQDEWQRDKAILEKQLAQLTEKPRPTPADQKQIESLQKQLDTLEKERKAEQEGLRRGRWRDLSSAARDATANQQMWSFWRAGVFWLGSVVFALGLLVVGFTGETIERWMCLVMLAIIVFRLYAATGG
jgi:hypothetical protein